MEQAVAVSFRSFAGKRRISSTTQTDAGISGMIQKRIKAEG
jgi:hypothetical protein